MKGFYSLHETKSITQFKVYYPYYGLFATAEVTTVDNLEKVYQCKLKNGDTVVLKKVHLKWIDLVTNDTTPLSNLIGNSIDDFLKK